MTSRSTKPPPKSDVGGIKILIMVGSLAATLGGWAVLAAGQTGTADAAAAQAVNTPNVRQLSPNSVNPTLRQVQVPSAQSRSIARTRSSR